MDRLLKDSNLYLMNTYKRFPVVLRKGRGLKVWDVNGKEYLDFIAGIAVNCLGHCHPKVVIAIQKQAQRLLHISNLYHIEPQIKLAKLLVRESFADKVFFCNSGAEAVEGAIKLARKYAISNAGDNRYEIITAQGSFHGRTLGALSATGQEKIRDGFGPLVPGFIHVPFGDIEALKKAISPKTCAIMLEPVQGEGGVRIPPDGYLKEVRQICDNEDMLLILDEIQTGMGRTGRLFAYEHFGIEPDIITLAKGLGGGVAIGAILAKDKIASAFIPGTHASTFGGNPLACAASLATVEALLEDGYILDNCRRQGEYLINKLMALKDEFPNAIVDVRGLGLLVGIELRGEGAPIVDACLKKGILINCTSGNVLRIAPPLIVTDLEIDRFIEVFKEVLGMHFK